jgi:S1-C subfamily serine protease
MHRKFIPAAAALLAWSLNPMSANDATAQDARVIRPPASWSYSFGGLNRAVLGVTLSSSTHSDTLGVRIDEVNPNGPASKAGLKPGMIITAIDGVSLRVSGDDAADNELMGLSQRRFTRTLQKAKPGDEVELRVLDGGQSRTMRVKTIAASELASEPLRGAMSRINESGNRPVVGMSIGVTGSVRDTLGLFVNSVTTDGPAEKAGIVEGDRIVEINGVDLRVPREDVEDMPARMARVTRFNRELQKAAVGDRLNLRVWSGGRTREVTVTTVKASDLPNRGFQVRIGDGGIFMGSPGSAPGIQFFDRDGNSPRMFRFDGNMNVELDSLDREKFRKAMEEMRTNLRELPMRLREFDGAFLLDGRSRLRTDSTSRPTVKRVAPVRRTASI